MVWMEASGFSPFCESLSMFSSWAFARSLNMTFSLLTGGWVIQDGIRTCVLSLWVPTGGTADGRAPSSPSGASLSPIWLSNCEGCALPFTGDKCASQGDVPRDSSSASLPSRSRKSEVLQCNGLSYCGIYGLMSSTGVPSTISTPQKYTEDPARCNQRFIDRRSCDMAWHDTLCPVSCHPVLTLHSVNSYKGQTNGRWSVRGASAKHSSASTIQARRWHLGTHMTRIILVEVV